ncbi:hypothetical protein UT300005_03920 [Clostridium sp. CTA-5]
MSNKQKSAFYSLHINNTDEESYLEIEPINLPIDKNDFSFDIWYYINGQSSEILSQKSGFSMGIEEQNLFIYHPNVGKFFIDNTHTMFKVKEWTNVFVSYDNEKLTVALNGIYIYSKEIKNIRLLTNESIKLGAKFSGYLNSFRIYKKALYQNDYKKYLFEQTYTKDMSDLLGFITFSQNPPIDLTPNKLIVEFTGECNVTDCIHVYSAQCENGYGYAKLESSSELNPGGFENGKFSIYAKVYIRPSNKETQGILSNGYFDKDDTIAIYTERIDYYSVKIKIKVGNNEILIDQAYSNWIDLLTSYDGNKLCTFINGELKNETLISKFNRSSSGDVKVGNMFKSTDNEESFPFDGYLATIGIFDKALSQSDASDFFKNQPFIFEDGIKALFSFDKGLAVDLVSSKDLTLTNNGLMIAQHTVEELNEEPYKYRVTKNFSNLSDINKWKTNVIASALVSYFENSFGIKFNFEPSGTEKFPPYFQDYIYRNFRYKTKFTPLFAEEIKPDELTRQKLIGNAADALKETQIHNIMITGSTNTTNNIIAGGSSLALGAMFISASTPALESYSGLFLVVSPLIITTLLDVIIKIIDRSREYKPSGDEDDDEDREYIIQILELSLQSNPDNFKESAIYCQNYLGTINPPEVIRKNTNKKYGVYIANEVSENIKVKAKFNLIVKKGKKKPSYNVVLKGYAKESTAFFNELQGSGTFSEGEHTIELTTQKVLNRCTDGIYKYNTVFSWSYSVDDYQDTDNDTTLNIYTIPFIPALPICLDKAMPKDYLNIDYIDLVAQPPKICTMNPSNPKLGVTPQILAEYVKVVHKLSQLRYCSFGSSTFHYFDIKHYGNFEYIEFDKTAFNLAMYNATESNPVIADCVAYAAILQYYFRTLGAANSFIIRITHRDYIQYSTALGLPLNQDLIAAGKNPQQLSGEFKFHMVVMVPLQEGRYLIYDASLRSYERYFDGIEYKHIMYNFDIEQRDVGSYLHSVFNMNTSCKIHEIVRFVEKPPAPIIS